MHTPQAIAERFRDLDFHDDTFVSMSVLPAQTRGDTSGSVMEIQLLQYKKTRVLRFIGCANLRVGIDFDVLAGNLPPNTSRVDSHVDRNLMTELMQSQKRDWDVGYGLNVRTPLDNKLDSLDEFVCFRVQFFGGAVEVIAREFLVESVEK
jgi:hypothetical protein